MSLATIGGATAVRARVLVGRWGLWWADVDLSGEVSLSGRQTLALADISLSGTVVSGGAADGRSAYRLVGGAGGWGRDLTAKPYQDDAGVRLDGVLQDLARETGETLADHPTTRLGPHYARDDGTAYRTLNLLARDAWRVGFDGVTRLSAYPVTTYTGDVPRTRRAPGSQVIELTPDTLAPFLPGVVVDGASPASDVEYDLDSNRLTVRVYSSRSANRRVAALRRLILGLFPELRYRGTFEYRVVTQSGERLNLQPARVGLGLPDLARVPVRPGMAGLRALVLPGELVLVVFADADPSRPQVISHDAPDAPGWMPLQLELGGPGALGVARQTDPVQAGPFAGVITGGSFRVKAVL